LALLRASIESSEQPPPELLVAWASLELSRTGVFLEDVATDRTDPILDALKQALLIDDRFAPTYDRLAIYYLQRARLGRPRPSCSGGFASFSGDPPSFEPRRPASQRIELARQAYLAGLAIDPENASLHNTAALVEAEDENFDIAATELATAVRLLPTFAEAHLNIGALALRARDYAHAENAYRAAATLWPASYDAHLGLALALQGQLRPASNRESIAEVERELARCTEIDESRPEAVFNRAVLTYDFLDRVPGANLVSNIEIARELLETAIKLGSSNPAYAEAVRVAQSRLDEDLSGPKFIVRPTPRPHLVGQCPMGRL
jgi:tetratricopeptide (TPR) repeat protein